MSEVEELTYLEACKIALSYDYFGFIVDDSICGNGFEILAYGIKLVLIYFIQLLARIILALLFPISAFLIMLSRKKAIRAYKKWLSSLDEELKNNSQH